MAISQNFPNIPPSLLLDFAKSKKLDSRITFTRGSTGTYVDDNGLIRTAGINEARFDHDPNTLKSLGLLLEESRTNLVTDSGTDYGYSFSTGNTPTNDVTPDGSTVACKYDLTGSVQPFLNVNVDTSLSPGSYTMTMWLKGTTNFSASFAFVGETTGEIYNNTANITTNWQRFTLSFTLLNSQTNSRLQVFFGSEGENKVISVWGAQLEAGRFATSYIRRSSGVTATRSLDLASLTGTNFSNWFNPSEGTTFISYDKYYQQTQFDISLYPTLFSIGAWPTRIDYADFGGVYQTMNAVVSGTFQADLYGSSTRQTNTTLKFIGAYKTNDFAAIGTERVLYTDTSGSVPTGFTAAYIGSEGLASNSIHNGHIAQLFYYPRRLSNTYLQELTK